LIDYTLFFLIIFLVMLFIPLGVLMAIYAPRLAPWFIQTFHEMGRKLGNEKLLIWGWGPFARTGFLTWWIRIGGILISVFVACASCFFLYLLFTPP
jgi:hypothetical protein